MEKMEASVEEQSPLIPDSVPVETQSLAKDRKKKRSLIYIIVCFSIKI